MSMDNIIESREFTLAAQFTRDWLKLYINSDSASDKTYATIWRTANQFGILQAKHFMNEYANRNKRE